MKYTFDPKITWSQKRFIWDTIKKKHDITKFNSVDISEGHDDNGEFFDCITDIGTCFVIRVNARIHTRNDAGLGFAFLQDEKDELLKELNKHNIGFSVMVRKAINMYFDKQIFNQ